MDLLSRGVTGFVSFLRGDYCMIIVFLVLFATTVQAERGSPENRGDSVIVEPAAVDSQSEVRKNGMKEEGGKIIKDVWGSLLKGLGIIVVLLAFRAIRGALRRDVSTKEGIGVFVTASSAEEAGKIERVVSKEGLASSGNLFPQIRSIYRWNDKIEDRPEALSILNTTQVHLQALIGRIEEIHSYDVPAIVALASPYSPENKPFMDSVMVFITCGSDDEALRIGRTAVEERLAASVNIVGRIRSIYRWQRSVQDQPEVLMIAKTTQSRMQLLIDRVTELHTHDVPEIFVLPIFQGSKPYLDWVRESTHSEGWWKRIWRSTPKSTNKTPRAVTSQKMSLRHGG